MNEASFFVQPPVVLQTKSLWRVVKIWVETWLFSWSSRHHGVLIWVHIFKMWPKLTVAYTARIQLYLEIRIFAVYWPKSQVYLNGAFWVAWSPNHSLCWRVWPSVFITSHFQQWRCAGATPVTRPRPIMPCAHSQSSRWCDFFFFLIFEFEFRIFIDSPIWQRAGWKLR